MYMFSHFFQKQQQEQWTISDLPMQQSGGKDNVMKISI